MNINVSIMSKMERYISKDEERPRVGIGIMILKEIIVFCVRFMVSIYCSQAAS